MLTIVTIGATLLHGHLLRKDRVTRVDQQMRDAGEKILRSDLLRLQNPEYARVDQMLSDELGDSRIGKFFAIRTHGGEIIFESMGAKLFNLRSTPAETEWFTLYQNGKWIRVLNLQLPNIPSRVLQVGIALDNALISPDYFSSANLMFLACIFVLGLATAWGLTSFLLHPLSQLVKFISGISLESSISLPALPPELTRLRHGAKTGRKDELKQLIESFSSLMERVNRGYKLSRAWSYQMAHELKTPLAIMEGEITAARKNGELPPETAERLLQELMAASTAVTEFLTWAELEGAAEQRNLYALPAHTTLSDLQNRLANKFPGRIQLKLENNFYVFSNLQHFEHLLLNLASNALHYSPLGSVVEISTPHPQEIRVRDLGAGIPPKVLERIGEPFNRGGAPRNNLSRGHGLGLAYVRSVCRLYGWTFQIQPQQPGTEIILQFPDLAEESTDEANFPQTYSAASDLTPSVHP